MKQYTRLSLTAFMLTTFSTKVMEPDDLPFAEKCNISVPQYQPEALLTLCMNHFGRTRELCDADGNTLGDLLSPGSSVPENLAIDIINRFPTNVIKKFTDDDECAQNIGNALLTQLSEKKKIAFIKKLADCDAIIQYRNILKQLMNDPKISDDIKKCINQCDQHFQLIKAFLTQQIYAQKVYAQKWSETQKIIGHADRITSISWSPAGTSLVTGSLDKTVKIWTLDYYSRWQCMATLSGHADFINSVSWSPDGKYIATGLQDETVKIWTYKDNEWQCIATLTDHTADIKSISWSPNSKYLVTSSCDATVKIWIIQDDQWRCITTLTGSIDAVSWSPDSKYFATNFDFSTAKIWTIGGQCIARLTAHTGSVDSLSWSPDGKYIAIGSSDKTTKIWTLKGNRCTATLSGHTNIVVAISWSPNGTYIATGSWDHMVKIWTLNGTCIATLTGHTDGIKSISWLSDGNSIATDSDDATIKIWDMHLLNDIAEHPFSYAEAELIQEIAEAHKNGLTYQLNNHEQQIFDQLASNNKKLQNTLHAVLINKHIVFTKISK